MALSQRGELVEDAPPDAWDEAEEETLLARVKDTKLQNDDAEADIRRRDAALLRDTEAFIARAMTVAGEQKMLLKLDDQFEKFMGNRELQHIKINGVSDKQVMLIKAVSVLFRLRTMQSDNSISIHKTEESIVPASRFGEPRNVAGRNVTPMEKPKPAEVKVMQRAARKVEEDDRAARLAAKIASKGKGSASDREKDYQNARNRIFNQDASSPTSAGSPRPDAHAQGPADTAQAAPHHPPPSVSAGPGALPAPGFSAGRGRGGAECSDASATMSPNAAVVPGPVFSKGAGRGAAAPQQPQQQGMQRKAVLTNKYAEMQDPDYDRSKFNRQQQMQHQQPPPQQQQQESMYMQQQMQQQMYMQQQMQQQQYMQDMCNKPASLNAAAPDFTMQQQASGMQHRDYPYPMPGNGNGGSGANISMQHSKPMQQQQICSTSSSTSTCSTTWASTQCKVT